MENYEKVAFGLIIGALMATAGLITYVWAITEPSPPFQNEGVLSTFSSRDQLLEFLGASERSGVSYHYDSGAKFSLGSELQLSSSDSYSRTNIQVAGVDEMDTVKTDGKYIYIASWDCVSVVNAYPAEDLANVSKINETTILGEDDPDISISFRGLFVLPQKLIVLSVWEEYHSPVIDNSSLESTRGYTVDSYGQQTLILVFDMADPAEPTLESSVGVRGYLQTARMIDDKVYLVAQQYHWGTSMALPGVSVGDDRSDLDLDSIYYDPDMRDQNSFLNMLAYDVSSEEFGCISIVAGYASTIYVSPQSIFLTNQKWIGDLSWANGVEDTANENKITTTILKVSFDGISMRATARGDVDGWLLNQFSMDEKDSYLRVATTSMWFQPSDGADMSSSVFVLDSDLEVVGALKDIAPTERIYSTRFVGDTLYMVTFRQVDPLFVIDLSDPAKPGIVGELEMPGFSNYLHPVDADHVLGIGSESNNVKISIYDVSDPTAPVEESKYVFDFLYSGSEAQYDHKAVLFDIEKALLVIPIYGHERRTYDDNLSAWVYTSYISGAACLRITLEDGISLMGMIEHKSISQYSSEYVFRSVYIGEYLYTISHSVVKASMLYDLSEVSSLIYWEYKHPYYYVL